MKVSFISGAALKGVKRVTVVRTGGSGAAMRPGAPAHPIAAPAAVAVRHVFVRADEDPDEVMKVTVVRPGLGVVKRLRVEQVSIGRKKQSGLLRPVERAVRKLAVREIEIASDYLARHGRSNARKPNGWVRDLPRNVGRAFRSSD